MRTLVLKDHAIDKDECLALLDDFSDFFKKYTDIECEWYVEGYDFSRVPTIRQPDGDLKPTYKFRQELTKEVHDRYSDYGVDNIVMLVHEKHFVFKGVWGVNWSGSHYKYSLQLCRWDKDNPVNTFGTFYHELMHSFDWVVKQETGVDINKVLGTTDYDAEVVHGRSDGHWEYIGRRTGRENTKALQKMAVHLRDAFAIRKSKHLAPVRAVQWKIINLLSTWLRKFAQK